MSNTVKLLKLLKQTIKYLLITYFVAVCAIWGFYILWSCYTFLKPDIVRKVPSFQDLPFAFPEKFQDFPAVGECYRLPVERDRMDYAWGRHTGLKDVVAWQKKIHDVEGVFFPCSSYRYGSRTHPNYSKINEKNLYDDITWATDHGYVEDLGRYSSSLKSETVTCIVDYRKKDSRYMVFCSVNEEIFFFRIHSAIKK